MKQPTPLDMLMEKQRQVRESCRMQEQKINEDFRFMHNHSGRILFTGLSSLFFSRSKETTKFDAGIERDVPVWEMALKSASPWLLEMALPVLMRWGVSKISDLLRK